MQRLQCESTDLAIRIGPHRRIRGGSELVGKRRRSPGGRTSTRFTGPLGWIDVLQAVSEKLEQLGRLDFSAPAVVEIGCFGPLEASMDRRRAESQFAREAVEGP